MLRILSGLNALYRNYKSNPTESNIFAARVIHPILDDKTEKKVFPDGESKITINQIPKKSIVVVVQSTYPPVDSNLLELLSIVSKVQKFSSKVFLVFNFFY